MKLNIREKALLLWSLSEEGQWLLGLLVLEVHALLAVKPLEEEVRSCWLEMR
jgi:hypothetical protein